MQRFNNRFHLNQPITERRDFALGWTVFAVTIAGVVFFIRTRGHLDIPYIQYNNFSLASFLIEITFIVSFFVTALGYRRYTFVSQSAGARIQRLQSTGKWLTRLAIALATGIAATISSILVFSVIGVWLRDASFPDWLVLIVCVGYTGGFTYIIAYFISGRGQTWLLFLAAGIFGGGILLAILVTPDLDWWTRAISFLGGDVGGIFFNMAFIIAGLILLAVLQDRMLDLMVMREAKYFDAPRLEWLHALLLALCVGTTGVGLFPFIPNTPQFVLHQIFSNVAALAFIIASFVTARLLPIFPENISYPSGAFGILAIILAIGHYIFHFYNFSALELMLIIVGAIWVSFFFGITGGYIKEHRPDLLES
ncbi:MAG: hypothetical protein SFZ02_10740 [bacterium]|nr:hypothetical protein [bacterium]